MGSAFVALCLALLFVLPTGAADHCNGPIVELIVAGEGLYIEDRSDGQGDINYWIYMETNGRKGLQTGGTMVACELGDPWAPCLVDGCWHSNPDQLIW